MEIRVFTRLAADLAGRGIASLRIDSAGSGDSMQADLALDYPGMVADATASLNYLQGDPRIDPDRVAVLGLPRGGRSRPPWQGPFRVLPPWRSGPPRLRRGRAAGLLGFSIDLPRPGGDIDDGIDALRAAWIWWRTERGTARPVVLLRSSSSRAATRAPHALHRWAAGVGAAAPIIRLDITGVCTTIAASTVVTVLYYAEHPGVVEVVVDHLPPTFQGVRVAGGGQPDLRTGVLIRDAHRMVATHIEGGPLTPGARLIAGGWSGLPGPVSVLEPSDARFSLASHQPGLSVA